MALTSRAPPVPQPPAVPPPAAASVPEQNSIPRPASHPEHPALRAFTDKGARVRLPVDFPSLVPSVSDKEEIAWIRFVLRDHTDLDAVRNEAANLLRRSHYAQLSQDLLAVLANSLEKERFASYAVQHLGEMMGPVREASAGDPLADAAALRERLQRLLHDPRPMVRSEALLALTRERNPSALTTIREGLRQPNGAFPQDLLIRCAKEAEMSDLKPAIRPLAYSDDHVVRIAALNVLAQWKDDASRPAFEEANRSQVARVQRAGELALRLLETTAK